jgi:hypothetical protein
MRNLQGNNIAEPCCAEWAAAHKCGSDNEGYRCLVNYSDKNVARIGCDLEAVRFCPWCGSAKGQTNNEK